MALLNSMNSLTAGHPVSPQKTDYLEAEISSVQVWEHRYLFHSQSVRSSN